MLQAHVHSFFHAWERRLSNVTTDRVVRPFDWGLDWLPDRTPELRDATRVDASEVIGQWISRVMADTDAFFAPPPTSAYTIASAGAGTDRLLTFPSALHTPHRENNTVYCR